MTFSFSIQPLCNIFVTYSVRKVRDFMSDSPSHDLYKIILQKYIFHSSSYRLSLNSGLASLTKSFLYSFKVINALVTSAGTFT